MTGKEALDNMCKKCCYCPFDESKCHCDEYNAIKKGLELLEILKKYTMLDKDFGNSHINTYPCSEDEGKKVKEWLKNE